MTQARLNENLEKIEKAITNLRRGKNKLTISNIAKKSGVPRRTIYNRPELKERCDQAILIQEELEQASKEAAAGTEPAKLYGSKLLQFRYEKVKNELKEQKIINAKILENNRKLVIEKDEMKGTIQRLQEDNERLREQLRQDQKNKVRKIK
ncbi:hypothetical protein DUZ99_09460 [Xylanibacillus composti]|uniref:Uncharacterized protein n=1 Tax=Xylanibacillus composti TaxID=1572762 RepID=A0A8J4M406_9BACL|nr:hypothetical protein [Xylanibacillus composti]MDT9725206.1 hypothetical protein [Xylanibacillus composti]GIQ70056.1 hypothetical protein XYCOK13_28800 [Xylanibacillus composti]